MPVRMEIRQVRSNMKVAAGNAIGANTTTTIVQAGLINASDAAKAALPITDHLKRNIWLLPRPLNQVLVDPLFRCRVLVELGLSFHDCWQ